MKGKSKAISVQDITLDIPGGLIKIDNSPVCRIINVPGLGLIVRFRDMNALRCQGRDAEYLDVPVSEFLRRFNQFLGDMS